MWWFLGLSARGFRYAEANRVYRIPLTAYQPPLSVYSSRPSVIARCEGTSLWVLIVNLLVYLTFFRGDKINWVFLILTLLLIIGPIVVSYFSEGRLISRMDMITLYSDKNRSLRKKLYSAG